MGSSVWLLWGFVALSVSSCGVGLIMRPMLVASMCGGNTWTTTLSCMVCHYRKVLPINRCCLDRIAALSCRGHLGQFINRRPQNASSHGGGNQSKEPHVIRKPTTSNRVRVNRYPSIFVKSGWGPGVLKRGL